jgi:hypothetical protein
MGKSSIIYVLGLSFIVSYGLLNINAAGTDAVDNFAVYYGRTMAHEIASSGANIACADLFKDPNYNIPYVDIPFRGGLMNIRFVEMGNRKRVIAIGELQVGHRVEADTVVVELHNSTLARYAWFTNFEANKGGMPSSWSTGDTAWGPVHTNDKFNINGKPVFMKKATAWQSAVPAKNTALWGGGYEWGIKVPWPANLNQFVAAANDAGHGRLVSGNDAYLEFESSGAVNLEVPALGLDTTFASAKSFADNGAFAVAGANLYVKGNVTGNLAIGAVAVSGAGGNVFVTGDIRYNDNPKTNPLSKDKLVIYADNDITVTYNNLHPADYTNRTIDASIFTLNGAFGVQDAKSYAPRGTLTVNGVMLQNYRGEIGKVVGGTLQAGYWKNFRFDERLPNDPPLYFPSSGRYTLAAWREN